MPDWRSYDEIAERYDRIWSTRFEAVARHIWARVPVNARERVLDIGTGTGVVLRIRSEVAGPAGRLVGCDLSPAMLRRARARVVGLRLLVADATALPFRRESFNVVTASFVLSHVRDYPSVLAEMLRVLTPEGIAAVSNWAPSSDPYRAAWGECLAGAISRSEMERAATEVAPWEEHFSQPEALEAALTAAGFSQAASELVEVESIFTVEQFLEDRELSSTGRFGFHRLGPDGWAQFRAAVRKTFHTRFGSSFHYRSGALIATARK